MLPTLGGGRVIGLTEKELLTLLSHAFAASLKSVAGELMDMADGARTAARENRFAGPAEEAKAEAYYKAAKTVLDLAEEHIKASSLIDFGDAYGILYDSLPERLRSRLPHDDGLLATLNAIVDETWYDDGEAGLRRLESYILACAEAVGVDQEKLKLFDKETQDGAMVCICMKKETEK